MSDPNSRTDIDVEALSVAQLQALRETIDKELEARRRANADDPAAVVQSYLEDAMDALRGQKKMSKSPGVGPAKEVHNGVIVGVCYKGSTSKSNSVSRWLQINDEWVWDSDRVVAEETDYPDFDRGYNGKVSVFALSLEPGDEVEVRNKKTHGSGNTKRTLYEFDGAEFERV
jgi:hypothetical protein